MARSRSRRFGSGNVGHFVDGLVRDAQFMIGMGFPISCRDRSGERLTQGLCAPDALLVARLAEADLHGGMPPWTPVRTSGDPRRRGILALMANDALRDALVVLAGAQTRTERRLETLTERMETQTERVETLTERVEGVAGGVEGLIGAVQNTARGVDRLSDAVLRLAEGVSDGMHGLQVETARTHAAIYALIQRIDALVQGRGNGAEGDRR